MSRVARRGRKGDIFCDGLGEAGGLMRMEERVIGPASAVL